MGSLQKFTSVQSSVYNDFNHCLAGHFHMLDKGERHPLSSRPNLKRHHAAVLVKTIPTKKPISTILTFSESLRADDCGCLDAPDKNGRAQGPASPTKKCISDPGYARVGCP